MRAILIGSICFLAITGCGGSESSDEGGTGGAKSGGGSGGKGATGGSDAGATGGSGTGATTSGGAGGATGGGGSPTGGSGGASTGGSAGTATGGSAGSATGGGAGMPADAGTDAAADAGACGKTCTDAGFVCCGDTCVNLKNDIKNCGKCANVCSSGQHPTCSNGKCGDPPCTGAVCAGNQFCCGSACCGANQLCCDVPGPIVVGPKCTEPVNGTCPLGCLQCKCAAPDTPIATPSGERKIAELAVGDWVMSVDRGRVTAVRLKEVSRTPAQNHQMMRVTLESGRVVEISPGHPTADGRTFAQLRVGSSLDGLRVAGVELVGYAEPFTYDILPDSDSAAYFAAGALVGTTLRAPGGAAVVRSDALGLICQR